MHSPAAVKYSWQRIFAHSWVVFLFFLARDTFYAGYNSTLLYYKIQKSSLLHLLSPDGGQSNQSCYISSPAILFYYSLLKQDMDFSSAGFSTLFLMSSSSWLLNYQLFYILYRCHFIAASFSLYTWLSQLHFFKSFMWSYSSILKF